MHLRTVLPFLFLSPPTANTASNARPHTATFDDIAIPDGTIGTIRIPSPYHLLRYNRDARAAAFYEFPTIKPRSMPNVLAALPGRRVEIKPVQADDEDGASIHKKGNTTLSLKSIYVSAEEGVAMGVPDGMSVRVRSWSRKHGERLTNCTVQRTGRVSEMAFCDLQEHVRVGEVWIEPPGTIGGVYGVVVDDFVYYVNEDEGGEDEAWIGLGGVEMTDL